MVFNSGEPCDLQPVSATQGNGGASEQAGGTFL